MAATYTYKFYNKKSVPPPNGLYNNSNICWANSLFQVLLGCPSVNEVLLDETSGKPIIVEYINVISSALVNKQIILTKLLTAFKKELKKKDPSNLFGNQQECVDEAFVLLLDALDVPAVSKLFNNRYEARTYCPNCDEIVCASIDPCQCKIELFSDIIILDKAEFIKYILAHPQVLIDYKCDKCGIVSANAFREYRTLMLREIITVTFNKYYSKSDKWFPNSLEFNTLSDTVLYYRLVGKVEHIGNTSGGHYYAHSLRYDENGNEKWYLLNDLSVSTGSDLPSPNTYMVIYHLFDEKPIGSLV